MASAGKIKKQPSIGAKAEVGASVTPISQWRKSNGAQTFVVQLPSGNNIRVKRIRLTDLLGENIFPDAIMKIVMDKIQKAEKGPGPQDHKKPKNQRDDDIDLAEALKSTDDLAAMMRTMDKVAVFAVVEPQMALSYTEVKDGESTFYPPVPFDERDENLLYTDEVSDEDKMEIFSFVIGGDSNLKTFR